MEVHVSLTGRDDLSGEIYRQLRRAILDGRLRPGDPLPPTRDLARSLSVSRNTATVAYDRLFGEGFVTARTGAGTYVSEHVPQMRPGPLERRETKSLQPRSVWGSIQLPTIAFERLAIFDFRTGLPDASLFPYETWRRLLSEQMRAEVVGKALYAHPAGHEGLRAAIARHIGVARGVQATTDDVLITGGTQQALDVIARTLLAPGETIAVEDPGYAPPRSLFRSLGLVLANVPVDNEGLIVDRLPSDARLVYITPSHQYPLGMSMSLQRRLALLEWADENDAAIIEDDYDSEFRFGGRPLEPLMTLDTSGRVIYVGSFSKTLIPILRLGFIVTPPSLREAMYRAKYVADWHTATPGQAALASFLDDGSFARHIRKLRSVYEKRHDLVTRILTRDFNNELELVPSVAGLHVTALARPEAADRLPDALRRASAQGVEVHELARIGGGPSARSRPGLMFGYGAIPTEHIEEGLRRLRAAFG
jgi:GntR family transcriptional regulator/MocR family aminotransferase